ncbi:MULTISPECIES: NADPH-dependent FMN reductase [Lactobacillaceae]|uniref:NADPH-dependent FMN reductase n=1 Tax=Lactobacillaceae TaxID=33958 RepID=UPI000C1B775B|nr:MULTISPECIES: NAD(P)H-dependent oxidoreductase [Lactobacillaceae]
MTKKISIIVGSLRENSFSGQVANNVKNMIPAGYDVEFLDFSNLPIYNQDSDEQDVPEFTEFRNKVKNSDGIIFVTPEYNRSIPGGLKNAIDVASRPWGQSVWNNKPAAIISNSPGAIGGFGASNHLRQVLAFLNMPTLTNPEAYLGNIADLLQEDGTLVEGTAKYLQSIVDAYIDLLNKY